MSVYARMTVNEKLVISRQIAEWDKAGAKRDRARMIEILMAADLTETQSAQTTDAVLANSGKSGYP